MSNQTKHAPEPWRTQDCGTDAIIRAADGWNVATVLYGERAVQPTDEANARRIVACVNACNGISTDLLENANTHGMLDLAEKAHKGKQLHDADRDELVEALKQSMVAIDDWLNLYASEECDPVRVKEAQQRISDSGATLAYIAAVQTINRAALKAVQS